MLFAHMEILTLGLLNFSLIRKLKEKRQDVWEAL